MWHTFRRTHVHFFFLYLLSLFGVSYFSFQPLSHLIFLSLCYYFLFLLFRSYESHLYSLIASLWFPSLCNEFIISSSIVSSIALRKDFCLFFIRLGKQNCVIRGLLPKPCYIFSKIFFMVRSFRF